MESIRGFHDHAHHLLTTGAALKFGEAVKSFHDGHAVIGYCRDSRLAVPVYETAFALDRLLRSRGERDRVKITIVSPEELGGQMGGKSVAPALQAALGEHGIEFVPDFPIDLVTSKEVWSQTNQNISYDLLMLLPPFDGPGEAAYTGLTDVNNYVRVDRHMRVTGQDGVYAAGDCLNLLGPKMGHMAVLQGEVAAANLAAEIEGRDPVARYNHEIVMVVDTGDQHSLYVHKKLWERSEPAVRQGRFWGWAKQAHKRYWQQIHS
jgi:sulfide:quinone oxidoreductase